MRSNVIASYPLTSYFRCCVTRLELHERDWSCFCGVTAGNSSAFAECHKTLKNVLLQPRSHAGPGAHRDGLHLRAGRAAPVVGAERGAAVPADRFVLRVGAVGCSDEYREYVGI